MCQETGLRSGLLLPGVSRPFPTPSSPRKLQRGSQEFQAYIPTSAGPGAQVEEDLSMSLEVNA